MREPNEIPFYGATSILGIKHDAQAHDCGDRHRRGAASVLFELPMIWPGISASPPAAAHCWTYWYWHAKATKEGITRDLEAMQQQGIEGVLVFPFGQYMKPEWIPMFQHVLAEAERLNLKIVLNNDTFWSCQAPWMTPELAEKKLVYSERVFDGGRQIAATLPTPPTEGGFYRDIVVLACPLNGGKTAGKVGDSGDDFKAARVMYPSYPAGGLDVFYRRSPEVADKEVIKAAAS